MSYAIAQRTNIKPSDGRWLLVAVVLHVAVFLIPLRDLAPVSISQSAQLVVRMVMQQVEPREEEASDTLSNLEDPVREVLAPRPGVGRMLELGAPPNPPDEPQVEPSNDVSTARLMGLRNTLTEEVPLPSQSASDSVRLGEPRRNVSPQNWEPHVGARALAPIDNRFNGMTVPAETVVVDSWSETDGSRGVILETPSGLRLCGRAGAWDPMRPMVEPLMQFRVCGGDGAIPFKFKPRKPLNRDFIDPVAKDANQP